MNSTTVAIDLAKDVFQLAISPEKGKISKRLRLPRKKFEEFLATSQPAVVVVEACSSASFWAQKANELGHVPVLLPPAQVKPYRRGNKTDRNDTTAILEAYWHAQIKPVPAKSETQRGVASLHRFRAGVINTRKARLNAVRAALREYGITVPLGTAKLLRKASEVIADPESAIPSFLRPILNESLTEAAEADRRAAMIERQLKDLTKQIPLVGRLMTIPGVGYLTATAIYAFVGDLSRFPSGRHLASYLGLVPSEHSSGTRRRLGAITKRGNSYLRMLLIHGGRSVTRAAGLKKRPDRLHSWTQSRKEARGYNRAATATASKLARIIWAVATKNTVYVPAHAA